MDLAKHIRYLLQFHECVIIPGFGGFISSYKPASFNASKQLFTPPSKQVIFNSKITNNDGLLINQLVDAEHYGYRQAQLAVLHYTDWLYNKLNSGQSVELENLGSFKYNDQGQVIFVSASSFDLIEAYGLQPFNYQSIRNNQNITEFKPRPAIRAIKQNNNWIKVAAGIAIVLGLSFFPLKNNEMHLQTSNLIPTHILNTTEQVNNIQDITSTDDTSINDQLSTEVVNKEKAPYILVGGSFEFIDNAQSLCNELASNGHQTEMLLLENGYFRVAIDSYFDKNEAIEAMKTYRANHPGSMVWVSTR
ncbi:MAG: hypothetical protein JW735_11985 [Prolixibacteraceae bacterium]|nr:hypothetical protein [Prolixibacteraceae bacterium]